MEHQFLCAGFVCWTLVLCLVVRFLGVFLQTAFVNMLRHDIKVINYQASPIKVINY
jgi:hypothetical protein